MTQDHGSGYRDAAELTKWTRIFLWLQLGMLVIAVLSGILEHGVLTALRDGEFASQSAAVAAATASDIRQSLIGVAQVIVIVISAVLILRWIHRANWNARALGAQGMEFSPGWSIGWYFVPFANLWKPYQAMREIWQASGSPQNWQQQPSPGLLVAWWTLWLVSNAASNAAFRMSLRAEELSELLAANTMMLTSDLLDIPLAIVMLAIIHRISGMQRDRSQAASMPALASAAAT
jgi:hypothetical protein